MLNRLKSPDGASKNRTRVGRGEGSGLGKTSGRGHKGQKARTGGTAKVGYEGGQTPIHRRLPKRGFTNKFKKIYNIINVEKLSIFKNDDVIDAKTLIDRGVVKNIKDGIKVLGDGEIKVPLTVKANKFTATAKQKIEAAGGKVEVI
ncbi:MAG: 50S ribosomal protein L15 [Deltaproteobacteria bacterium GWC2_42_51]|nr:MAG: 50S ribosomal protein L15 [Deltaproteobacteria bacterium GWA2_42_85]OGP26711.1 MAG: 50S ribosomal protein L15 [Deltaproteobacteria bacterium GWB2_42_7]OGP32700.1 MAG: 50S ribosomal protein L15 [Deltaproteobacteria bacterium GWC2_42_51]OGP39110.1 MAG: 50S ribosomal protein L15 [Deltaproteobacteria bacterium GWD2_42_10]OGP47956.1 MAG: 50S ribosomal protein L15 [Deltaproteobacteria bacterium GWF2_42_12]OGQ24785.1 MAG: 50S ribosomal protein L15 [Deltaproteobacteria bacterium RIFCSPHIGHO2_0